MPTWYLLDGKFHAQITARDHKPVSNLRNFLQMCQGQRLFDLGHYRSAAFGNFAGFGHIFRPLNERQGEPIDAQFKCEFRVAPVFFCQGGHGQQGVGHVNALAVGQFTARYDLRNGIVLVCFCDAQTNAAIVEQQGRAFFQRCKNLRMRDANARFVAWCFVQINTKCIAIDEIGGSVSKGAYAQLWALQIGQNADRTFNFFFDLPDEGVHFFQACGVQMAHVQAEDICTRRIECTDHLC